MGRYIGPVCRLCRREGIKLMLKGSRCESAKCPMEKQGRNMPPGQAKAFRRGQGSEYGKRLRETQKVKRYYGLFDTQFRRYFERAAHTAENTGTALLTMLERRLDNVVTKLGFAPSRRSARISIGHGHFSVNGHCVNKPGYLVRPGDKITVNKREGSKKMVKHWVDLDPNRPVQGWLKLDGGQLEGQVVAMPGREDVQIPVEEQLIVEFCNR
ncbi:30S ribosomal protein S4 [Phycisphaerae bacterium RAS2]|nr:30S ribosomal protein S4 [Phycisphaerae bacterium RAS2]